MPDTSYYEALNVKPDATADDIKRAYRKMARKYHPDVTPGPDADAKFKAAGAAYDVLRDPEKRAEYDRNGADWDQPRPDPGSQSGFGFDERDVNAEMFRRFFDQGSGAGPPQMDQIARIEISLEDAIAGATRVVSLQMPQRDISLRIPKGVAPGQHLRLQGQSAQGGDLYVEIAIKPHPIYQLDGRDIFVTLPVTPWEAALGGKVKMPTPAGPVDLTIPSNARQGQKLRLRGRGLSGAQKGDLYAVLQIENPPDLSANARDLYRALAQESSSNPRSKLGV